MSESPTRRPRLARLLLGICGVLVVAVGFLLWRAAQPVALEDLGASERARLLATAEQIAPSLFQSYPPAGPPLFYHFESNALHERAFGADFRSNEIGFRSPPLAGRGKRKRLLLIGDSWTFGPHVRDDETPSGALAALLREAPGAEALPNESWEVQNLSMVGWNLDNQLAALRAFFEALAPDLVVFCTTSNDIDDGFALWRGRLVSRGFDSGALFKPSYEYERRWSEAFAKLDEARAFLTGNGVQSFVYLLAEWRELAPYYAERAGFKSPYAVVPTPYLASEYRLPREVDPSLHPSPAGYAAIMRSLAATLASANMLGNLKIESDPVARRPGLEVDEPAMRAEFSAWWPRAQKRPWGPLYEGAMGVEAFFSAVTPPDTAAVALRFELIDRPALYPLEIEVELLGGATALRRFERYLGGEQRIELALPSALRRFPAVEARASASRVVSRGPALLPASIHDPRLLSIPAQARDRDNAVAR